MHYKKNKIKKILILFLAVNFLIICLSSFSLPAWSSVESEKEKINNKIIELKRKEKLELNKLTKTQQRLESTKSNISDCKDKLASSRSSLNTIRYKLNRLNAEQDRAADITGKRLRQLYKGEKLTVLNLILTSNDLSTFLDRVYYHKILNQKDRVLFDDLRNRAKKINKIKVSALYHKNNIAYTLNIMNKKKKSLDSAVRSSEYLINKLRTDRQTYEKAQKELAYLSNRIEDKLKHSKTDVMITTNTFIKPVSGYISSPFGWRRHPIFKSRKFHTGVDIAGRNRSPIKASNGGKVIHSGWYGGYGKVVIIEHGEMATGTHKGKRFSTLYAHMNSTKVKVGDSVKRGETVGYEGTTGYSTGPHLHFEIRIEGKPRNPKSFVRL